MLPAGFIAQLSAHCTGAQRRGGGRPQIPFKHKLFSGFNFTTSYIVCITAMINTVFLRIHIYVISYSFNVRITVETILKLALVDAFPL